MSEKRVIVPTIGRQVWVRRWPHTGGDPNQPCAATVCFVHNDRMINVAGFDHNGLWFKAPCLTLRQPDDEAPQMIAYAEWMGFQIGQSVKTEDLAGKISARVDELEQRLLNHLNNAAAHGS